MHFRSYIRLILRTALYELIDTLDLNKAQYVVNPSKDFKRKRKLDFKRLVRLMLTMGSRTISGEIENEFLSAPTESSGEKSKDKTPEFSFTKQHKRPASVYYKKFLLW